MFQENKQCFVISSAYFHNNMTSICWVDSWRCRWLLHDLQIYIRLGNSNCDSNMDWLAFQCHETSLVDLFASQMEWNWCTDRYLFQKKKKRYQYYLINTIILIKISAPESTHWPSLPPSLLTNWDFKNACIFTKYIPVTRWVFTQNASTSEVSTILST